MASKSVYQSYDTTALNHFGLDSAPYYGMLSSNVIEEVLLTQDETTFLKIRDILTYSTEDSTTFKTKKKAFVLPKCNISLDRIKSALKEHGISVTNDYELADLIITHDDIYERFENGENIKSTILIAKLWNYQTLKETNGSLLALDNYHGDVIYDSNVSSKVRYYNCTTGESLFDEWMVTGMAVNLAHKIDGGLVGTIDADTVIYESANKQVLDETLLEDIQKYLSSYSDEDRAIAAKVIPTIDYQQNYHLLWQFAQDAEYSMRNFNRDKDVQYWLEQSNFNKFYRKSAHDMILWLEVNEKLNSTNFKYLEPIVRQEIHISNRDLYVFKVQVKPEYLKYIK
tara:strand:+ start:1260 stop:2282 length:1023 start_codon:yes stop_codon:yes gene_type:complete